MTRAQTITALGVALLAASAAAQDLKLNVRYVCNGEHIYLESCNIRDTSDNSTCMVAHPDRPSRNGIMVYTNETRGTLKALLPTCQQPSAKELDQAEAFKKKQQELYDAAVKKANPQPNPSTAPAQPPGSAPNFQPAQAPKTPEQRAMARCITSGRLPATCTGNSLLGAFGSMISQVLPSAAKQPPTGPAMAGVFAGAGNWRLEFTDESVLVSCSFLSPDEHHYGIKFENNRAIVMVDTTPKPLVLTLSADETAMTAPGPFVIDGVVANGSSGGGPTYSGGYKDSNGLRLSDQQAATSGAPVYDNLGNRVLGGISAPAASQTSFAPRRTTCPALNLSSKGAGPGAITMATDVLKTAFGGEKGPPTPPGIRMRGIFAASTGFSAQFFPESVILGCGPDAARAYPYSVAADGTKSFIKVDAPDHPLTIAFRADGALDPGTGPYQVHGRIVTGQNNDGDFTFAPLEQTCNLAALTPAKQIPATGGVAATTVASAGGLSTPAAPLGNATLAIVSGFPAQPGVPNPLAGHPYILLRDPYAGALAKAGVVVPADMSPYKFVAQACASRSPDCQRSNDAIKANAASAVRADANGAGTFPGVAPGTYYLMISARYNNQPLMWVQAVQLKPGVNSITLDASNATPMN